MQSRSSRSDQGIVALATAVLKSIFGLSDETSARVMKLVHNQGQFQDLKNNIRMMSGVAHRRLNDVIDMADQRADPELDPSGEEDTGWEYGTEAVTFAGFLLNELQYTDADLRDPAKKQQIMRMMRADDSTAQQMVSRQEREQKTDTRQDIQQEKDPQRSTLLRKKQQLQQQIMIIDKKLGLADDGDV